MDMIVELIGRMQLPASLRTRFIARWALSSFCLALISMQSFSDEAAYFHDISGTSGVNFSLNGSPTSHKYLLETMVGGVAVFDYDGDGRMDLFFVNGARLSDPMPAGQVPDKSEPQYWNRLYRNAGGGKFEDVTASAGVAGHSFGMGVAVGDYDNDGLPDLYVTNYGRNILFHNDGQGRFSDVTAKARVEAGGWSTGAAFVDVDNDGRLDLFVSRYLKWDFRDIWCGARSPNRRAYCHPDQFEPISHLLYRNLGNGVFENISDRAGIAAKPGKGLGVAIHDFDQDGRIDIVVANDSFPQQLFHNLGNARFEEIGLASGVAYDDDGKLFAGMGIDFDDYDNDRWPDIFINALGNQRYALFQNVRKIFEYASGPTGIGQASLLHSGWGTHFFDYDNDGWKDLFVAQGHVMDNVELTQPNLHYLERLLLMRNTGGKFADVSGKAGPGFQIPVAARGAVVVDLDNDGGIDLVVSCLNHNALVLRNTNASGNHWLTVRTIGSRSNRDGIGARVTVTTGTGRMLNGLVSSAGSYLSARDPRVHFGLGKNDKITKLDIVWPSGQLQTVENVTVDRILAITEPNVQPR
jgi:hypothetical protein